MSSLQQTSFYPSRAARPNPPVATKRKPRPETPVNPMFKELAWKLMDFRRFCDPEEWTADNIARIIHEWSEEEL